MSEYVIRCSLFGHMNDHEHFVSKFLLLFLFSIICILERHHWPWCLQDSVCNDGMDQSLLLMLELAVVHEEEEESR